MKKIFRMANAELSKIFMRPSMFVLTGVLIIALIFSFFFFKPESSSTKFTYSLSNTTNIYTTFERDYNGFESQLISAKTDIDAYIKDTGNIYQNFTDNFHSLKQFFVGTQNADGTTTPGEFPATIYTIAESDGKLSAVDLSKCERIFTTLRAKTSAISDYMLNNIKNKQINFIITESFYNKIYKTLTGFYDNIPSNKDLSEFSSRMVVERYNMLKSNYDLVSLDNEISKLETITIDSDKLKDLLDKYFYINFSETKSGSSTTYTHIGKLETYYNNVIDFYNQHIDTAEKTIVAEMNEKVAEFYDYIQICKALISNEFELLRIGNKTDDQIATYIGFSGVSIYNLKKQITTSRYFFDNETFGYEYLTAFNFNKNSGTETNAYDFAFYSMQILSMFITVFVIFFATSSLSGEQSTGTLKMIATRPYTRNKIFSGKFLACFNVALILLTVSLVSSLAIGFASYGFSFQKVLVVMNAETLFITNPVILLLIYLASILVDIVFYIALAIFVSMVIKQATVATGLSSAIYLTSIVLLGSIKGSWIRFVPSLNLQLYKFFTISQSGMFSYSVVPNTSLFTCGIFTIAFIVVFDLFARFLFTHRSLDK
ncbi:MAG: ABC transporter permease subunit [Eubacteriales bacterium]|nr:ABC transporter permease subunit [Eubacteriales bacterium]